MALLAAPAPADETPNGAAAIAAQRMTKSGDVPRVLFVGNSFTYQHDLPALVAQEAAGAGVELSVAMIAVGGHQLHQHVIDPVTRLAVADGGWDVLVLQDFSTEPLSREGRRRSERAALRLVGLSSAIPVFFATWPRAPDHPLYSQPWNPSTPEEMMRIVARHYDTLAGRTGGSVSPVGQAFTAATARGDGAHLYRSDGYHASPVGAELAAAVLAETILTVLGLDDHVAPLEISAPDGTRPAKTVTE